MSEKKSQSYLRGAAILAATVVIVKILGAVYKIALGNIIGDEGYAHFTVAYNIFAVLLSLSTAGLPVALSRMISEADALGRRSQIKRIFAVAAASFCVLGAAGSAVMLFFPGRLAAALDDAEAARSILALSPSIFFVCLMSAYRGYTQGHSDMKQTSVSQIIEVLGKVVVGTALAWIFVRRGLGLPKASAGAIAGVTAGSVAACAYSAWYYIRLRRRQTRPVAQPDRPDSAGRIFKALVITAVPIALGSSVLNILNLVDTKIVLARLQGAAGFSFEQATALFGVYGKVQALFNLPAAFVVPLTVSIIPAISAFAAQRQAREASAAAASSLKLTTLIGMPAGIGLTVLAQPIMRVLFPGSSAEGVGLLALLGVTSYFVCMTLITNAILQAYGHERLPVLTMLCGGAAKVLLNLWLVGDPKIGIYGAAVSTLACYALISVLNLWFVARKTPAPPAYGPIFIRPAVCAVIMGYAVLGAYRLLRLLTGAVFGSAWTACAAAMCVAVVVGVAVYGAACILLRAVTREDMKLLPKGEKLAALLHIR